MTSDIDLSATEHLALNYGKPFGALVASGMAAIELALELLQISRGDEVVVPNEVCFRVPAAVLRKGVSVVFAPTRDYTIDPSRLMNCINERTKAVIAVHHFGLPCRVEQIKEVIPSHIAIIEDAAQALNLVSEGSKVGSCAEYVVSSFGANKPICLGGGGGLFGDNPELELAMEGYGDRSRNSLQLPRSYAFVPVPVEQIHAAVNRGVNLIANRKRLVSKIKDVLIPKGVSFWEPLPNDEPSWHRLPLTPNSQAQRKHLVSCLGADAVVEEPHEIHVTDLPMFQNSRSFPSNYGANDVYVKLNNSSAIDKWLNAARTSAAN